MLSLTYGASIALFFAAFFYMLLFAASLVTRSVLSQQGVHNHIIFVFVLAGMSYAFFGLFSIYALQLHFPYINTLLPSWVFEVAKYAAVISLVCFTVMFARATPIKSLQAFSFWQRMHKYYNILYVVDALVILAIALLVPNTHHVVSLSLLLFVPHCLAGVVFSLKGLPSIGLSKFYALLFFITAATMLSLALIVGCIDYSQFPLAAFLLVHLGLGVITLMLSFVVARFNQEEVRRFIDSSKVNMSDFFLNIYKALKNEEFYLVYQPKVDLKAGKPCGMEALIRWQHPQRGNIPPAEFIPAAEQTDIIDNICQWVIVQTVTDAKTLLAQGIALPISINFSVKNLYPKMIDFLQNTLRKHSVPPSMVVIEITESLFLHKSKAQIQALKMIDDIGIGLSLDDFGAGFSSLSHLDELGIDEIKIDKFFIIHIEKSEKNRVIVDTTIQLARALNMRVVAEGVEDEKTCLLLASIHCDCVQGFGIAKPMPLPELLAWLQQHDRQRLRRHWRI